LNVTSRFKQPVLLSGSVLLSHPSLRDPNFSKTVVFLSNHSESEGTLGVVLNRPLEKTLTQMDKEFAKLSIGDCPVYDGGPVDKDKLILAAWDWKDKEHSFRLHFGIDITKAESLIAQKKNIHVASFLGHSGWSPGQLEDELDANTWVLSSLSFQIFNHIDKKSECWRSTISSMSDELRLQANAPEKPWRN
jgi:putative transcriptional regulator